MITLCTLATTAMVFQQWHSGASDFNSHATTGSSGVHKSPQQTVQYASTLDSVRHQLQGWREHELINLTATQRRELVEGIEVNQLLVNGVPVSANLEMVDRFLEATGAHATVFVREGSDFVRVATTLENNDGTRAVGSFLGEAHAGYGELMQGNEFSNRVTLFGHSYIACYFPLLKDGEVYAVLFAGLPLESMVKDIFSPLEEMGLGQIEEPKNIDLFNLM